jgi:signal transduction histidine kinase
MARRSSSYSVSIRSYVRFALLMALPSTGTSLLLLLLFRRLINTSAEVDSLAEVDGLAVYLFSAAALAAVASALAGLWVGRRFSGRIRGIVEKADAMAAPITGHRPKVVDELGALDAAMGRLTLSMDRFIRDRDILARLPEGMLVMEFDGTILFFNATAESLLDSLEQFRGKPILAADGLFPLANGNTQMPRLLKQLQEGRRSVHRDEVLATTALGQPLLLEVTIQRRDAAHGFSVLVMFFRDASEKRRIREQIRRADQLAFLGGLAARVAHEIRTPQAMIRGLVELLQADLAASDPRRAYIDRILHGLARQDRLVEDLLTLSHPEPETWGAVAVPVLLNDVLDILPGEPKLLITYPQGGEIPTVWGDALRLSQVFANLIRNAVEATPEGTPIDVTVEQEEERVRVAVRNTGVGIPPELQDRIFQPFFTTKARGTGLGLAIARQIVEAHRGSLRVESDGKSETTFVVELPVAPIATAGMRD